jgi:hypothetical protein
MDALQQVENERGEMIKYLAVQLAASRCGQEGGEEAARVGKTQQLPTKRRSATERLMQQLATPFRNQPREDQ